MTNWKLQFAWWPTQMEDGRWAWPGQYYLERDGVRRLSFYR